MRPLLALSAALLAVAPAAAENWTHWRGPLQTGFSPDTGLPGEWEQKTPGKDNLVWKQPVGVRSTPCVLNGKVVVISNDGTGLNEGERVVCLDEATGKILWEDKFNVFHTDIVSNRVGWTSPCASEKLGLVYVHGTGGLLTAYAPDGTIAWRRSMTEEFGRSSGYGGRLISPIFDDENQTVIFGAVNSSWGNHARGASRFYALDGKTGSVVWVADPCGPANNTHNSSPVLATINGERLVIAGGADGTVVAIQANTGKKAWAYPVTSGVVNGAPVVDGNFVYVGHNDENLTGGGGGAFVCLDAAKITAGKPKLVWEYKKGNIRFGLANPAIHDGRVYAPDDQGKLFCFDAKKGKLLWKYNYGRVSRGSPLIADGKCYLFEVNANLHILKLNGDEEPEELSKTFFRDTSGLGFVETNCTPCAVNGRVIFGTRDEIFSIGTGEGKSPPPAPTATEAVEPGPAAQLLAIPGEVAIAPGSAVQITLKAFDTKGNPVSGDVEGIAWDLPAPPPPPLSKLTPPALKGKVTPKGAMAGEFTADKVPPGQQGLVVAKAGKMTAAVRVRVVPQVPYKVNFDAAPVGAPPSGWVNAAGKFVIAEYEGQKCLAKVNTSARAPLAKANAYITLPTAKVAAIECDILGTEVREQAADAGVIVNRYTLVLDGKKDTPSSKRRAYIAAWEAVPRLKQEVEYDWKPNVWYRVKLEVTPAADGKSADVQAKIWPREDKEPADWTIRVTDPRPQLDGSAGLFGSIKNVLDSQPGSAVFYDNLAITPASPAKR